MLRLMEVKLQMPDGMRVHPSMGSVLHGALMEKLPSETAAKLHAEQLRPYSQSVFYDKERESAVWRFGFLEDAIYETIASVLQEESHYFLRQKQYTISCGAGAVVCESSYSALTDKVFLAGAAPVGVKFRFRTTGSFKRSGQYVLFPEPALIWQNLQSRWNTFTDAAKMEEKGLAERLASFCRIWRYHLQSQSFSLEHQAIYGYGGTMHLQFLGNDMTNRLMGVLALFAPFAGIGIKTALGMGAVDAVLVHRKEVSVDEWNRKERTNPVFTDWGY